MGSSKGFAVPRSSGIGYTYQGEETQATSLRQGGSLFLAQPSPPPLAFSCGCSDCPRLGRHRVSQTCLHGGGHSSAFQTGCATPGRDGVCLNGAVEVLIRYPDLVASCASSTGGMLQDTKSRAQEGRTLVENIKPAIIGRPVPVPAGCGALCPPCRPPPPMRPSLGNAPLWDGIPVAKVGSKSARRPFNPEPIRLVSGVAPGCIPARLCRSSAGVASHSGPSMDGM